MLNYKNGGKEKSPCRSFFCQAHDKTQDNGLLPKNNSDFLTEMGIICIFVCTFTT